MTGNNMHISIVIPNVNGLNTPITRSRIANWVIKHDPTMCCLQDIHLTEKNKHWLRVKVWKKFLQANGLHNEAGLATLISDKVEFRLKSVRRDNEGQKVQFIKGTYQFLKYMH
jgi:exonuclease III